MLVQEGTNWIGKPIIKDHKGFKGLGKGFYQMKILKNTGEKILVKMETKLKGNGKSQYFDHWHKNKQFNSKI